MLCLCGFGESVVSFGGRFQPPRAAAAAWLTGSSPWWLIGGVCLGAVIPFTLVVIFPTNKRLLDPSLDRGSELASKLLRRWGRLHAVRSVLSAASFLIFVLMLGRGGSR